MPGKTWKCLSEGCRCQCHAIARGRQTGNRAPSRRDWTPAELRLLRTLIGNGETVETVVRQLDFQLGRQRSRTAVARKAWELGLIYRQGWYSESEIRTGFGVHNSRVRAWRESGALPGQRHVSPRRGNLTRWWRFDEADVLAFIDRYAGVLFNPATVRRRDWRARAEVAAARNARSVQPCPRPIPSITRPTTTSTRPESSASRLSKRSTSTSATPSSISGVSA